MDKFEILKDIIDHRRTTKPAAMNGKKIDDDVVKSLLALADWAPTHAMTEPWRFVVFAGEKVKEYTQHHAEMYKASVDPLKFNAAKYHNLADMGNHISHAVIVYMKRGINPNIPVLEEICAVAAAVQNILLGTEALGISSIWSTGGATHAQQMKDFLQLREEDIVIGQLYLGYTDDPHREGKRIIPLENKITWNE